MFPRILRYFEEAVPLTQSFKRQKSNFFSSLKNPASKERKSNTPGTLSSCACDEGDIENVENGAAFEVEVEVDHADEDNREGLNGDNTNGEGESGEDGAGGDGEKDVIDELEYIVDT